MPYVDALMEFVSVTDTTAKHDLGDIVKVKLPSGRGYGLFRYSQTRVALTAGDPVTLSATNPAKFYVDRTYGTAPATGTYGVANVAVAAASYFWCQISGYVPAVTITSASPTLTQPIYGKSAGTGAIILASGSTDATAVGGVFGYCASSGSSVTTIDAYINCA